MILDRDLQGRSKTQQTTWQRSRTALFLAAYLVILSAMLFALFVHWAYDDPFITYRYAQNLDRGLGFVYNPGEKVLSTTTPLFAMLLAMIGKVWPDLPRAANLIGAVSLAAGGILLWDLCRAWGKPVAGWICLALYPTFPLLLNTLGSETPLYLAFCIGAYTFYARRKYTLAALFSAFAVLARPDGIIVPALFALDYLLRMRRPIPWKAIGIFLAITFSWFAFAWIYFGSPIPATLAAKQHQGAMAISQQFAGGFLAILGWYSSWPYILETILAIAGFLMILRSERRWLLFFSWPILYFAGYSILGVSRYFWYYAPLVPGFIAAVGLGFTGVEKALRGVLRNLQKPSSAGLQALLLLLLFALPAFGQGRSLWRLRGQADMRYQVYRAIGDWLRGNTVRDDQVGALEVGIIGYYAQRPMVDFAGLLQPLVAQQLKEGTNYEDAALWAVAHYHPDYLVLQQNAFPRLEQVYAGSVCERVKRFPGERYHFSNDIEVYACGK